MASGLGKRPPAHHRAKFSVTPLDGAFVHTINRDAAERYTVTISNGDLKVFRMDGTEVSVAFPNGKTYLASMAPSDDFRAVSVVDYTFILNRSKVVSKDPAVIPPRPHEAILWVKQGAYSSNYTVSISGISTTVSTLDANSPVNAQSITTNRIADGLVTGLRDRLATVGLNIYAIGSVIYIAGGVDFTVTTTDGLSDNALKTVKNTVQNFSDLPAKCVEGFKVRVKGSNETPYDDYYVEYVVDPTSPYGGVWTECAKPGEQFRIVGSTLPHALVRKDNGTFSFEVPAWVDRTAGSLLTAPFPSFVDSTVEDIFFHRNRLGLLSGENVVLSRSGEFFNFSRKTALQVLDTDPIDVAVVTGGGAATLRHAIAFNEGLLLFSDQTQYQFGKSDLLTPKTASITLTTQFGCNPVCKPVGSGKNVYFALTRGEFSSVREYYLDVDTRANDAADITAHVPRYLPKNISKLVASPNEDIIVALSDATPRSLFVYRYYWQGNAKLQSSWSRWDFADGTASCPVRSSRVAFGSSSPAWTGRTWRKFTSIRAGQITT